MPPAEKRSDEKKKLGDAEEVLKRVSALEEELAHLRGAFEQYFMGVERKPPTEEHEAFKRKLRDIRSTFVRATSVKFKVQGLSSKYQTYERLWDRTLKEMEAGTYRRDVFKAKLRNAAKAKKPGVNPDATPPEPDPLGAHGIDDEEEAPMPPPPAEPAPAAKAPTGPLPAAARPQTPVAAAPVAAPGKPPLLTAQAPQPVARPGAPAPAAAPAKPGAPAQRSPTGSLPAAARAAPPSADALSDQKVKAIYDAYVMAKRRCNEDTSKLSLDSLATTLRKQMPDLLKQHNAKSVEFKVVIKDGKAVLRALPKT